MYLIYTLILKKLKWPLCGSLADFGDRGTLLASMAPPGEDESAFLRRARELTRGMGTVREMPEDEAREALAAGGMILSLHDDPAIIKRCLTCASTEKGLKSCNGCGIAHYCSRSCQRSDWPEHKPFCQARRAHLLLVCTRDDGGCVRSLFNLKKGERLKVPYLQASDEALRLMLLLRATARASGLEDISDRAWPLIIQALMDPPYWFEDQCPERDCLDQIVSEPMDHFIFAHLRGAAGEAALTRTIRKVGLNSWATPVGGAVILPRYLCAARRSASIAESTIVLCTHGTDQTPFLHVMRDVAPDEEIIAYREDGYM